MPKDRMSSVTFILSSVELLRALKTIYPYSALSAKTGLAKPVLCRYVKGTNLPSEGTAKMLNQSLQDLYDLKQLLSNRLRIDEQGYIDAGTVAWDSTVLCWVGRELLARFGSKRFTKVLTVATDGVPLASAVAVRLGIPLVIAKRSKEVGIRSFIEESYVSSSPPSITTLYLPRGAISTEDYILIVDDIIRTGRTVNAVLNLVKRVKATAPNIYILLAMGRSWKNSLVIPSGTHLDVVLQIDPESERRMAKTLAA